MLHNFKLTLLLQLPIKIDIIKHKHEIDGKSTAGHAAVLASEDVKVYTYPHIPHYEGSKTVLIFPSIHAVSIQQLFEVDYSDLHNSIKTETLEELPKGFNRSTLLKKSVKSNTDNIKNLQRNPQLPITKAVFIDSTWSQSKGIYKDERIRKLPCVFLQNRISQFWRHQKGSPRWYLSTIEAIHQFLVEIHLKAWGLHSSYEGLKNCFGEKCLSDIERLKTSDHTYAEAYNGQYDDLLFFFKHMYDLIHAYYDHDNLYAYKRRLL